MHSTKIDPALANEPVSSNAPAFRELMSRTFENEETVVVLLRYANHGGAKDYYVARSSEEFDAILRNARAKTSVTVFFKCNFSVKGIAGDQLCELAIQLFESVRESYEGIELIRIDGSATQLDDDHYSFVSESEAISEWFSRHRGSQVLVGTMEFWQDNCAQIVSVYVPDDDGVVRPGAY